MKDRDWENIWGWLVGERDALVRQSSVGTTMGSPEGKDRTHSPPEAMMTRSKTDGPKNQVVKRSQVTVSAAHFAHLRDVRMGSGLVSQENKKIEEAQAQVFLMK